MSATVFIAVQCCQCSTMQVKQKKKSSNKWTCVVCNQKQSVRKVFVQGFMAKDIRNFVQSFNMSRKFADESGHLESLTPTNSLSDAAISEDHQRKRRSDWDDYLEQNLPLQDLDEGDELEPKIVTEWPKEMFKKPKLGNHASGNGVGNSYKPVFSKRNTNHHVLSQSQDKGEKHQSTKVIGPQKWSEFMTRDYEELRTTQQTMAMKGSQWDAYITNDDNNLKVRNGRNFGDDLGEFNHDIWETMVDDQKVEDDIHPDFL